jgi:hypothetical protein
VDDIIDLLAPLEHYRAWAISPVRSSSAPWSKSSATEAVVRSLLTRLGRPCFLRCMPWATGSVVGQPSCRSAMKKRSRLRRTRDFLLYVAIGVGIVGLVGWLGFHQARTDQPPGLPLKWLGFAGMTALVFGRTTQSARRWWRTRRFWLLLAALLIVQSCVGVLLLLRVPTAPLILYALLTPLNSVALEACMAFFLLTERS